MVTFKPAPPPPGAEAHWYLDVPFCWEFIGVKSDKVENFGWLAAIEELTARGFMPQSTRVGMVVDSDLGNLSDYNNRRKPFIGTHFLPPNVQLIYASADVGKENIVNKVLSVADSVSGQVLDAVISGEVAFNKTRVEHAWFEGIRIIRPNIKTFESTF